MTVLSVLNYIVCPSCRNRALQEVYFDYNLGSPGSVF
jgi:hypothetical protein